jgi:hypothetical protein
MSPLIRVLGFWLLLPKAIPLLWVFQQVLPSLSWALITLESILLVKSIKLDWLPQPQHNLRHLICSLVEVVIPEVQQLPHLL